MIDPEELTALLNLAEEAMKRYHAIEMRQRWHVQDWNVAMVRAAQAVKEIRRKKEPMNCCEHGDHEAPEGQRFCSESCQRCELESTNEETGCDGICGRSEECD